MIMKEGHNVEEGGANRINQPSTLRDSSTVINEDMVPQSEYS